MLVIWTGDAGNVRGGAITRPSISLSEIPSRMDLVMTYSCTEVASGAFVMVATAVPVAERVSSVAVANNPALVATLSGIQMPESFKLRFFIIQDIFKYV